MWTIFRVQNQLQNFTYLGGIEKFVKTILTVSALLGLKLKKKKNICFQTFVWVMIRRYSQLMTLRA